MDERARTFSRVRDIAKMGPAVLKSGEASSNLALKKGIIDDDFPAGETEFTLTDLKGNKVAGPLVAIMIHVTLKSNNPGALFSDSGLMERTTKAYTKSGVSFLATPVF